MSDKQGAPCGAAQRTIDVGSDTHAVRHRHCYGLPSESSWEPCADSWEPCADSWEPCADSWEPCADGVAYMRDAGAALAALADAFPPAAALLLLGGDGAMLGALARLHDALVPQLLSLARRGALPEPGTQVRPRPFVKSGRAMAL